MAKKPPIRVALDLETTGLHAEQDAIVEVAAIKFQGETVLDRFETLLTPGRAIPFRVQRLTGITPQQLSGAPAFEAIAKPLQTFLGDFPIVGHSIPFDVGFLRRRGLVRTNQLIDTFELATVLLPSLPSYNLGQVAESLGVQVAPGRHRAMVDTVLAMQVFLKLHERLQAVDLALIKDLANLDAPRTWPLLTFFRQELREREEQDGVRGIPLRGSLGDRFAAQLGMDPRILSFAIARQQLAEENTEKNISAEVSPEDVSIEVDTLQTLGEAMPGQSEQPAPKGYQAAHATVREALEQRTSLLMEVTIGGTDFTPALLPALEWLNEPIAPTQTTPRRLVIACATQQSARRLVDNILPRLQAAQKSQLPVAYLAERGSYLCVHRWFGAALRRTSGELTAEQARGLAKIGLWAQQTLTGERSELTLLPQESSAWDRISSGVERVPLGDKKQQDSYERCVYQRKGYCFVSLAAARVNAARIVVTTHAGLFDDLSQPHSLLADIDRRLILDADLLEEENARWSGSELDRGRLLTLLQTIGVELQGGRYQGLLALAAPSLRENGPGGLSTTPTIAKTELDTRMFSWFQTLRQARSSIDELFRSFARLLEEYLQQGAGGGDRERGKKESSGRPYNNRNNERTDQPMRLSSDNRNLSTWLDTERAWQQASQRLQSVIDLVSSAQKIMLAAQQKRPKLEPGSGEDDSLISELAAVSQQLLEQKKLGQQAMSFEGRAESDMVYWLRMPPTPPAPVQQSANQRQGEPSSSATPTPEFFPVLYSQLVQTSTLLKRLLLNSTSTNIFVGTALSVDHSFAYCRGRLGLEHDACSALSVVTDHHEQTLLYLPNDVPEPNTPQYQRNLDDAIVQLATALNGRLVVLQTSHAALRSSYATVKPLLEARGILVLGQGVDGSPRQLWHTFQEQERVVVIGTGSFWEGVDDVPLAPTCLLIARLPMPVLNDPPVAARAEHYSDQLHQLTVPIASLRLRRTLNRLAWGDTKRNAVILYDRRVISKEYGSTVLHTLPRCSQRQENISHMPETILDWLSQIGAWE